MTKETELKQYLPIEDKNAEQAMKALAATRSPGDQASLKQMMFDQKPGAKKICCLPLPFSDAFALGDALCQRLINLERRFLLSLGRKHEVPTSKICSCARRKWALTT